MYIDRLIEKIEEKGTPVICGLDPNIDLIPKRFISDLYGNKSLNVSEKANLFFAYNKLIIDEVHDLVPAIKPQIAYYEALGIEGMKCLMETIKYAKTKDLTVILDAKRNDIGSTSEAYAIAFLSGKETKDFEVDCMTIIPYMGYDSMSSFFKTCLQNKKGVFVCVKTSNPGSADVQNLKTENGKFIYEIIAEMVNEESKKHLGKYGYSNIGAVVGATFPAEATALRKIMPNSFFLVPGLGSQGGDVKMVRSFFNEDGKGAVINFSRGMMYPNIVGAEIGKSIRTNAKKIINDVRDAMNVKSF